ncbi:Uncharacterized protein Rs2_14945 [Raphanus sativus]|nr:Uncharacterized protein Rs2_14945 [Raphanus sativus]
MSDEGSSETMADGRWQRGFIGDDESGAPRGIGEKRCDIDVRVHRGKRESCRKVQAVISILKPEAVFVELCSSHLSILKPQTLKEQSDTLTLLCKVFIKISVGDESQRRPKNLRFGSII